MIHLAAREFNFDGLVGPTHNYSGLSSGNIASESNRLLESNPREAALQGLDKMRQLSKMGLGQALIPPQERPDMHTLRALGFSGSDENVLQSALKTAPYFLNACGSGSSMWTANAATVCPSMDASDARVHLTPANLNAKFHRAIEPETTLRILRKIFSQSEKFTVHAPLPSCPHLGDEGAANHTRLCRRHGEPGVHFFVYGKSGFEAGPEPRKYPARQTREASQSIARMHGVSSEAAVFAQQSPEVIDLGVFHNDVISVGNESVFLFHEAAFVNGEEVIQKLNRQFEKVCKSTLVLLKVKSNEVTVEEAVKSYLFNSQLVTMPGGKMAIIAPLECKNMPSVHQFLQSLIQSETNPIHEVVYLDVRQSMRNGGGPACLRLRVVLTEEERAQIAANVFWTENLDSELRQWVGKHYRDRLNPPDLADPKLLLESRTALDELTQILKLGSIYPFQN